MADWSLPTVLTLYSSPNGVLDDISGRLNDSGTLFNTAPSNQPDHVIRFLRSPGLFQEWLSATWNPLLLDVTGGGTGAGTASGARTNLGLGTLATQNANAIAVTGGTESGVTIDNTNNIDAGAITSGTVAAARLPTSFSSGMMMMYGGSSAPSGWLICDGTAVSRTTYATLFGIVGVAYGAGDGSTTFNLPDLRQRFPLGKAASGTGSTLGGSGGTIDHTHTSAAHTHTYTQVIDHVHTITDPGHSHTIPVFAPIAIDNFTAAGSGSSTGTSGTFSATTGITINNPTGSVGATGTTASTTPGVTGTNNPPFQTVNYIIKT
jgi:microcystin-dependent protein